MLVLSRAWAASGVRESASRGLRSTQEQPRHVREGDARGSAAADQRLSFGRVEKWHAQFTPALAGTSLPHPRFQHVIYEQSYRRVLFGRSLSRPMRDLLGKNDGSLLSTKQVCQLAAKSASTPGGKPLQNRFDA